MRDRCSNAFPLLCASLVGVSFLGVALSGAAMPARAQSAGNPSALNSLGPVRSTARHAAPRHRAHHASTASRKAATPAAAPPATPRIPPAPPPPAVIHAPVIDVPLHPEPPPPPVPVVAGAAGSVTPIAGGTRISFGADSADLNAATMAALQHFVDILKVDPDARAQIDAYAHGTPDDPSTPRRTSLERGLAARAVLIHGGIASTRIYVRVIGAAHGDGPADRVDLTRSDLTTSQQTAATR